MLLTSNDPAPFIIENAEADSLIVFTCEHAGHIIPEKLGNLGLPDDEIQRHIGWDLGIESVTHHVSQSLNIPSIYCPYSRLVVEINRTRCYEAFWIVSDTTRIPGNEHLRIDEMESRLESIYDPYHKAVDDLILNHRQKRGYNIFVISMHSYTPKMRQDREERPWDIGVSSLSQSKAYHRIIELFEAEGLNIGKEKPYDLRNFNGTTLHTHAHSHGLHDMLIEIRQDLISDEAGQKRFADICTRVFKQATDEELTHLPGDNPLPTFAGE